MKDFSYEQYNQIIAIVRHYLPIIDFSEVYENKKYCVIRHDVEYSVERALKMAQIEEEAKISSSYVIQIRNNNYNALSDVNLKMIREIHNLGHPIGLHVHTDAFFENPIHGLATYIKKDADTLSNYLGFKVDRFSVHRPVNAILMSYLQVDGLINMNDRPFFHFCDKEWTKHHLDVTYLADSNHQWKYGNPFDLNFAKCHKLQLNCHPDSWSDNGANNLQNFINLFEEKRKETIDSFKREVKTFPEQMT
jgi:hypothetical protein